MLRKQGTELLPLRKVKSAEMAEMADERVTQAVNQEFAVEVP